MSRNDILYVCKCDTKYYVLYSKDDEIDETNWQSKINENTKYTYSRAKALIIAHNKQKQIKTEYGVHELY